MTKTCHKPVLLKEILEYLSPSEGQYFLDCTLGGGGYSLEMLSRVGISGKVMGIDLDEKARERVEVITKEKGIKNLIIQAGNFRDLKELVSLNFKKGTKFNGVVADLGLSNDQLKDQERTFSFNSEAKLNMSFSWEDNFGKTLGIINSYSVIDLERILKEYGQERFAKSIAKNIVKERKSKSLKTAKDLKELVEKTIPRKFWPENISVATKTFQALRIETNDELNSLKEMLPQAIDLLEKGGRLAIVSFHSLEDRIVKNYFKQEASDCICPRTVPVCVCNHKSRIKIINKKPITPSEEELKDNPSSRSAKLRVVEKI
ncbi:16S rRNA (cytosine(1402)-N(4))-methyltransferase RsmH [bacterium]|nr:16S rRNA (cytosine(1402)-N(4))-methyltransferase RsmH [bacterium]